VNARRNASYTANAEQNREKARQWRLKNKDRINERLRKLRQDPKRRLDGAMRTGVWRLLRPGAKEGRRTYDLLGFTRKKLMAHLERKFADGMSWENYGRAWHVDHIVPLSVFNYETPDDLDFKRAWSLRNLQPLWAKANNDKRAKLSKPFQPSLRLSGRIE
jgi:5-methylcytosine-specific restriction endonuclease McrA